MSHIPMGDQTLLSLLVDSTCPDCGGDSFLRGPEGGLCTNIKCAHCGACFNFCPRCNVLPGGYAERIGRS
jgi:hypothetical protein